MVYLSHTYEEHMAVQIFCPALKPEIFKRQWRIQLIELSILSVGAQQLKSVHILVVSRGRAKKNFGPESPTDMCCNEQKNHLTLLSL